MNSEWRTNKVVAICQAMRETQDYTACPILADALEDEGCDDVLLLARLRLETLEPWKAQRLVALIYSVDTALAVRTVESFAMGLGMRAFSEEGDDYSEVKEVTYERMMRVGERWTNPDSRWGGDYTEENGGDDLRDNYLESYFVEFWEAYHVITGRHGSGNPFGCSC